MKRNLNVETSRRHSSTGLPLLKTTHTAATNSLATRFRCWIGRAPLVWLALLALALTVSVREASAQWPPPALVTLSATAVTRTNATLNGMVNPNGYPTTAWFQWGTTTNYGYLTPVTGMGDGTNALPVSALVAGLTLGTTYHFRAAATNVAGVVYGSDHSLTALPPPEVWTLPATAVTTTSATLNGTVNPNGSPTAAWFQWGTTTNYGNLTSVTALGSGTTALPLSAPLAGLTPGVTYHFRVAATNDYGLAYGSDQSFTTSRLDSPDSITRSPTARSPSRDTPVPAAR